MVKNNGPIFNKTPDPLYFAEKQHELDRFGAALWGHTYEAKANKLVERTSNLLGVPFTDNIVDLAKNFEEDIAIMHNGILSAICFCFPSGWIPADKIGMTLAEIHQPVADNHHLVLASQKLAKTMSDPVLGSFRRQVWTVTQNPRLSNHPHYKVDSNPNGIMDLFFRMETQTTAPLGDGVGSVFFVKVDVVPLSSIWDRYGTSIRDSINSMSESILEYKNLKKIKSIINNIQLY